MGHVEARMRRFICDVEALESSAAVVRGTRPRSATRRDVLASVVEPPHESSEPDRSLELATAPKARQPWHRDGTSSRSIAARDPFPRSLPNTLSTPKPDTTST